MKKQTWLGGILASLLTACSPSVQNEKAEGQIDVLPAFENLTELKVSHLGKNIRYVPLETTDSSVYFGNKGVLLEDKILVSMDARSERHCFLFDRQSGKFIREIAQFGEGPKNYTSSLPKVHPVTKNLHFRRYPGKLLEYNQNNQYLGEISLGKIMGRNITTLLTESGVFVYEGNTAAKPGIKGGLYFYDYSTERMDTISTLLQNEHITNDKAVHIKSYSGATLYGLFGYHGPFRMEYKNGKRIFYPSNFPVLWSSDESTHFWEVFSDTIFRIKDRTLEPRYIFNLGERHFPVEEHGYPESTKDYLVITYVMETTDLIYFQCVKDMYGEFHYYNGLYRKANSEVLMSKGKDDFTDDLTHFIPFRPLFHTEKGEFVGILKVEDIQEWLEEHPETKLEGALAPLKDLAFDANPVVVIVEP